MFRVIKKYRLPVLFILVMGTLFLWQGIGQTRSPYLRVNFLDVGQGDAIFIESPEHAQVLIDGGPGNAVLGKLSSQMPFWDRTIDLVVVTHPQLDHLAGLVSVLGRYRVKTIMLTGVRYPLGAYRALLERIAQSGVEIRFVRGDERIIAGGSVRLSVLNPDEPLYNTKGGKAVNESSIVLRLDYGETSFLFTGDAGFPSERDMMHDNDPLDTDVLKVGHHGSRYASSDDFLRTVSPKIAVIQAGKDNRYGHPTEDTLERLAAVGALIFRTDRDGDVEIVSDGVHITREQFSSCLFFC